MLNKIKRQAAAIIAIAMMISVIPASSVEADGNKTITVWVAVDSLGTKNSNGEEISIGKIPVLATTEMTATDAVKTVLDNQKIEYSLVGSGTDEYWESIIDLGYNADTGCFWNFVVNGKSADVGTGSYTLKDGDRISFVYKSFEDNTLPKYFEDNKKLNPSSSLAINYKNKAMAQKDVLAKYIY